MVICKDRVYVLSVPDSNGSTHGKFATHESAFVHDLVVRLTNHTNPHRQAAVESLRCRQLCRAWLCILVLNRWQPEPVYRQNLW